MDNFVNVPVPFYISDEEMILQDLTPACFFLIFS